MACAASTQAMRALRAPSSAFSIPLFLVPRAAASQPRSQRTFTSSSTKRSKIGSAPLTVPPEVTFTILPPSAADAALQARGRAPTNIQIKGPLGEVHAAVPFYIQIDQSTQNQPKLKMTEEDRKERKQRAMWGTTRAFLANHILGVSEGHTAILSLVGVGYRATVESTAITKQPEYEGQKFVSLKVGYSHPIELGIPKGVQASTPQPTRILLEGVDKHPVMQFAAEIRAWRKPEPYKGKGIFVNGETIKLKNRKIK